MALVRGPIAAAKNTALRAMSKSAVFVGLLDSDDFFDSLFVERSVARVREWLKG